MNLNDLGEWELRAWQIDTLAKFAFEQKEEVVRLREANEQLRLDLKDAMLQARKLNLAQDPNVIEECFDAHASAIDGRMSKADVLDFVKHLTA